MAGAGHPAGDTDDVQLNALGQCTQLDAFGSQQIPRLAMIEKRDPKRLLNLRDPARDGGHIDAELLGRGGAVATVT